MAEQHHPLCQNDAILESLPPWGVLTCGASWRRAADWDRLCCPANFVALFWIFLGYFEIFAMDFLLAHGE